MANKRFRRWLSILFHKRYEFHGGPADGDTMELTCRVTVGERIHVFGCYGGAYRLDPTSWLLVWKSEARPALSPELLDSHTWDYFHDPRD